MFWVHLYQLTIGKVIKTGLWSHLVYIVGFNLMLSWCFILYLGNVLCRVSQEEWTKLRESVPYVKMYRYNPKHLYPKLNGYRDNGHRKVWASGGSTYCMLSVTPYWSTARAWQQDIVMQWPWRMLYSTVALTSQDNNQLRPAWSTWKPKDKYDNIASVFVVQFSGFMSLSSYFDVKYRY